MSIAIIVVQVVLGLLFMVIGSMNVVGMKMFVENFRRFGYSQWFRIVTGSLEVLGGIGLLIGIWLPWLTVLASAGLTLVMLGAFLTEVRTSLAGQSLLHGEDARVGGLRPRTDGRQRHPARPAGGTFRRRCGSHLLL